MVMIINLKNFIIAKVIRIYQQLINPRVCKMSLSKFQASDGPDVADRLQPLFSVSNATTIDLRVPSFQNFSAGTCPQTPLDG